MRMRRHVKPQRSSANCVNKRQAAPQAKHKQGDVRGPASPENRGTRDGEKQRKDVPRIPRPMKITRIQHTCTCTCAQTATQDNPHSTCTCACTCHVPGYRPYSTYSGSGPPRTLRLVPCAVPPSEAMRPLRCSDQRSLRNSYLSIRSTVDAIKYISTTHVSLDVFTHTSQCNLLNT
jgi:hypothetical protein